MMIFKSFKSLSLDITEKEYRNLPSISYSLLSRFDREGWRNIDKIYNRINTSSLEYGGEVDTYLTDFQNFFNKYHVEDFGNISFNIKEIVKDIFNPDINNIKLIDKNIIHKVCKDKNYYADDKYSKTRLNNIITKGSKYYNILYKCQDKILLSRKEFEDVKNTVNTLLNNKYTSKYFSENYFFDSIEAFYQLKFNINYKDNIFIKCMIDRVIINHVDKTIQLIDLKTSSKNEEDFEESFKEYRYYIQAQLYTYIIKCIIENDSYFNDFTILPFKFIVINKKNQTPIIWTFDKSWDYKKEGFNHFTKLIDELNYYFNNIVDYSIDIIKNKGELILNF